ncbi:MAG TPA: C13 family peptidase [Caulobacteraceae bacterium]
MKMRLLIIAALVALGAQGGCARAQSRFSNWAAIIVAGDYHAAHTNNPTETFDNARRDVAHAFEKAGFSPANLIQFSVRPQRYLADAPRKTDPQGIFDDLRALTGRAPGGCLIYFTTHGSPQGIVLDDSLATPRLLRTIVANSCGARPTVIILSACFSGVFIPALKGDNRMILTAARSDRASFGCSEADIYPFFDGCVLEALPAATGFLGLAPAVGACVAKRERAEDAWPPSKPQLAVGKAIRPLLAASPFRPRVAKGGP